MAEISNTLSRIETCLARLNEGDASAWNELFEHAFDRLLVQCRRIVGQMLSRPNPLITENAVLAEAHHRLRKAMESEKVRPTTAREFFGLAARNVRWQVQDMLRKRSEQKIDNDVLAQFSDDDSLTDSAEEKEKWDLLWAAVDNFSEDEREVFDLIWINGLSQYEAADTIGKTRNQVDSIWRRIKIAIAKSCKDYAILDS